MEPSFSTTESTAAPSTGRGRNYVYMPIREIFWEYSSANAITNEKAQR